MAGTTEQLLRSRVTTLSAWITGIALLGVGLLLMWWSGAVVDVRWSSLLAQVGGVLVATSVLSLAWDILGRRALANEILAKAKLSTDLLESGVASVETDFYKGPDWESLFSSSGRLDLFVSWGRTWRTNERSRIQQFMRRGGKCRVFLPDPRDERTVGILAQRFSKTKAEVQRTIAAAVDDYRDMHPAIEVHLRKGEPMFTFYRFDNAAIYAPYNHGGARRLPVPALVMSSGKLMDFIDQELAIIEHQSEPAPTGKMEGAVEHDHSGGGPE